jgi:hypothetical protein
MSKVAKWRATKKSIKIGDPTTLKRVKDTPKGSEVFSQLKLDLPLYRTAERPKQW